MIEILLVGKYRRKDRGNYGRKQRGKSNKKETGVKGKKEPVKIDVKPICVGKQEMAEVFGSVALENIRQKMKKV